jgi:CMP-N-acetylneuraminic acid synthetase
VKDPKELAVYFIVRKNSKRCKNKLLRDYADTTLFDIALRKISKLNWPAMYVGIYEEEFRKKAEAYSNLTIIERSYASANTDTDVRKTFEILNKIPHKWVFWINPCHAFLKVETIRSAIDTFLKIDNRSMTSVKPLPGWFYRQDGTPLNNTDCSTGVNKNDYLYIAAHAFHCYERIMPVELGRVWENVKGDPYLFPISHNEAYDVDTEEDFLISETLYPKYGTKH